jgi:hypothetical protein
MNHLKLFHICTISNDVVQYERMKASFLSAGFNEDLCTYTVYDNSVTNKFDPYQTFNSIRNEYEEPYIILCHQDIVLDQGDKFSDLVERLDELQLRDPNWAICGNAGVNFQYQYVVRIADPANSPNWQGSFPQRVISLDENFLVIKESAGIKCSSTLKGFHFYGSDLCLQAIRFGYSCYSIDFHLSHLSSGKFNDTYWEIKEAFYKNWNQQFKFSYYKTMTGQIMCFSSNEIIRKMCSMYLIRKLLFLINQIYAFLPPTKAKANCGASVMCHKVIV